MRTVASTGMQDAKWKDMIGKKEDAESEEKGISKMLESRSGPVEVQ